MRPGLHACSLVRSGRRPSHLLQTGQGHSHALDELVKPLQLLQEDHGGRADGLVLLPDHVQLELLRQLVLGRGGIVRADLGSCSYEAESALAPVMLIADMTIKARPTLHERRKRIDLPCIRTRRMHIHVCMASCVFEPLIQ